MTPFDFDAEIRVCVCGGRRMREKWGFRVLNRFGDFKERRRFYQITTVIDIVI